MDKKNYLTRKGLCMLLTCCFVLLYTSHTKAELTEDNYSDVLLESRIFDMNSHVDMKLTDEVKSIIKDYTSSWKGATENLLGLSSIYFPIYEKTFKDHGIPLELKFLSVVESGLRPEVRSKSGAVGLWQFMKGTARLYNLKVGNTIDERKDILKSTEAAAKYLRDLEKEFGDWTLALAAYNCGPGNVRKAIRRSGSRDFWEMRQFLPKETRRYVPKFIAVSYVMNYYTDHGLVPAYADTDLTFTTSAKIFEETNFNKISDKAGVEISTIKALNPSYLKSYIPKSDQGRHTLTLPVDGMNRFLINNYSAQIIQTTIVKAVVKRPEVSLPLVEKSKFENRVRSVKTQDAEDYYGQVETRKSAKDRYEYYKLSKRETLSSYVKRRSDVSLESVMKLNDFSIYNPPLPGAIIKVKRL